MGYPARVMDAPLVRTALDDLPVFPLPELVFLPDTLLPLHIFEPRYRAMTRHCLDTHRAMAVARLLPGPGGSSEHPPFAQIAGVGVIVDHEELADGRFNLLLRGELRVRLSEHPPTGPFRRARAEDLPDLPGEAPSDLVTALLSLATAFIVEARLPLKLQFPPVVPPEMAGPAIHQLAATLLSDAEVRQQILEERDPAVRCSLTLDALDRQRAALPGHAGKANRDLN